MSQSANATDVFLGAIGHANDADVQLVIGRFASTETALNSKPKSSACQGGAFNKTASIQYPLAHGKRPRMLCGKTDRL
jgi:hypothetical protein